MKLLKQRATLHISLFAILILLSLIGGCSTGSNSSTDPGTKGSPTTPPGNPGGNPVNSPKIANVSVSCATTGDDSTPNPNGNGSAVFVRSYTVDSPVYHSVNTRKDILNRDIWLDYSVHEPVGSAKGIVVLIAGGSMNAMIYGTDGQTATYSGVNYLVRSAHRYEHAGYRVITLDRPSDYSNYGDIDKAGYLYDAYRTSIDHAIDITTVINRENSEDLPVFIAGTSRGAISVIAQSALAAGIDISSPVTVMSASGTAVGAPTLPIDNVLVPVHVLYHIDDSCSVSPPANSAALIGAFATAGVDVSGNNVSGGFADAVAKNPCGALDYHGFTGIENCAVNTSTTWMDDLLTAMETQHPGNIRPVAQAQSVNATIGDSIDITLNASDSNATDMLTYALPYTTSSLSGKLTITGNTVHYTTPQLTYTTQTTDRFVFTVTDSQGSRSAAVVEVALSQPSFDHGTTSDACSTCHDLPVPHISIDYKGTPLPCSNCHGTDAWLTSVLFDHASNSITVGNSDCSSCHNNPDKATITTTNPIPVTQPPSNHSAITADCDACHGSTEDWMLITNPL